MGGGLAKIVPAPMKKEASTESSSGFALPLSSFRPFVLSYSYSFSHVQLPACPPPHYAPPPLTHTPFTTARPCKMTAVPFPSPFPFPLPPSSSPPPFPLRPSPSLLFPSLQLAFLEPRRTLQKRPKTLWSVSFSRSPLWILPPPCVFAKR